ncbi:MAG: hypothetical protein D6785_05085, partial [Planctomycetota bacterium]
MAVYKYKAINEKGMEQEGMMEGETPKDVRNKLRLTGYYVTTLEEISPAKMASSSLSIPFFRKSLIREVTGFTRQLSTLLKAGINLDEALRVLIHQTESSQMQAILRDVRERIRRGDSFGESLKPHNSAFSELYVNMVKAGEASGNLPVILDRIGQYYKKQNQVRGKVAAALTYPIIMIFVGTCVV